jgi:hypothetical protein
LFPARLTIRLAPAEVVVGAKTIACDPAFGAEPWHGALEALRGISFERRALVTVVLSSHFVRYALVAWSDALGTPQEEENYLRHHFAKVHGERAKPWLLRASEGPRGTPRLASAVDAKLIDEIKRCFPKGGKAKLVSVQPALMHVFNSSRKALPAAGAWLVIAEPERACVALHSAGAFRSVQNGKGEWRTLLERERHRVDGEIPSLVLLAGAAAPAGDAQWSFRECIAA